MRDKLQVIGLGMATLDILVRTRDLPTWGKDTSLSALAIEGGGPVATALFVTAGKNMVAASRQEKTSYFSLGQVAVDTFKERCEYYIELFGAAGKA
jgi:hypothetical protein